MATHTTHFVKIGTQAVPLIAIARVDASQAAAGWVVVHLLNGEQVMATGIDAVELAMQVKPSMLEGQRLHWGKHRWLLHNMVGHPLMQLLAVCHLYRWAFWVHDATVPRPRRSA